MNYAWLFAMACWALLDIYWRASAKKISGPIKRNFGGELAIMLIYAAYCLPLSSHPILGLRIMPRLMIVELLGACLCALGVGFAIYARRFLAENWNAAVALNTGHRLLCNGPYAVCRHPIYLGFLTAVMGMVLALGEVRALVLLIGLNVLLSKMGREEAVLRATYPDEYPRYEKQVKRLVPWIW